ncbi:hypothetical protein [Acinetobacter qingfengensis]|nr:hypothetical protein [Acinetobacter qingfengensis]
MSKQSFQLIQLVSQPISLSVKLNSFPTALATYATTIKAQP